MIAKGSFGNHHHTDVHFYSHATCFIKRVINTNAISMTNLVSAIK